MDYTRFLDLLGCPECLEPLEKLSISVLCCRACRREYPIYEGVPVLMPVSERGEAILNALSSAGGRQMQKEYAGFPAPLAGVPAIQKKGMRNSLRRWLERLREPVYNTPVGPISQMFNSAGASTRILSVGGGPTRNNEREINLNIGIFPNVDVVGDAHRLPFLTGSVDGAWANAVLEHVEDAPAVAREMERVVKPGGHIAVLQPFIQAYHSYPTDYWRFTRDGVARLFPGCELIAQGTYVGPTFALLKLGEVYLTHYLPVLLGLQRGADSPIVKIAVAAYTVLFYWLKWLDRMLAPHASGHLQASVVYWIGRKKVGEINTHG